MMTKGEQSKGLSSVSPLKLSLKWGISTWKLSSRGYDIPYRRPEDTLKIRKARMSAIRSYSIINCNEEIEAFFNLRTSCLAQKCKSEQNNK